MRIRSILALLLVALTLAACGAGQPGSGENLTGDAARGAELFTQSVNGAPACSTCHTLDETTLVGPSLQGFGARVDSRVEGGSTAEDYAHTSIVQPSTYIVSGFSNLMYGQYAQRLTPQEIADLVAYLLTL